MTKVFCDNCHKEMLPSATGSYNIEFLQFADNANVKISIGYGVNNLSKGDICAPCIWGVLEKRNPYLADKPAKEVETDGN